MGFYKIPANERVNPTFPSFGFIGGHDAIVEFDIYHLDEALFVLQLDYLRWTVVWVTQYRMSLFAVDKEKEAASDS